MAKRGRRRGSGLVAHRRHGRGLTAYGKGLTAYAKGGRIRRGRRGKGIFDSILGGLFG